MSPLRENKAADGSLRVAVIGAGGVATSLVPALAAGGARVTQVFSRTLNNARRVAATVAGCEAIDTLALLTREADVYVIAVKDDAIARVLDEAIAVAGNDGRQPLWLHTSGSTSIDVFGGRVDRCGVLYPMQSFSRSLRVEMSEVYFFTEGNNEPTQARVDAFARLMSPHVTPCDSRRREQLHIAAVFACNFANSLWTEADEIMTGAGLPFRALLPLIRFSVDKLNSLAPRESQTGPAQRRDTTIINRHLEALDGKRRELYKMLTDNIIEQQKDD